MCKIVNRGILILTLTLTNPAISQEILLQPPALINQAVTRDVSEYTSREQAIIASIENNDNLNDSLLASDFEVWLDKGNDWQSKEEWLKTIKQRQFFNIRNLSVRQMDDIDIVSFLLESSEKLGKNKSTQFIVDIWRKSTNKLNTRYISDVLDETKYRTGIIH